MAGTLASVAGALQRPGAASPLHPATLRLPSGDDAPGMARAFLNEHGDALPPGVAADAALMINELVTNAVVHGQPPIALTLTVTAHALEASVTDAGPEVPLLGSRPVSGSQEHGRGLQIVDALADGWGIETGREGYGTRVWFRLPIAQPGPAGPPAES